MGITFACSCSDIKFGDDFLGTAPESNESTLDSMFSSKLNAEKVLTQAYTYLPYGLIDKLGTNQLECLTDLSSSYRENASDGPTKLYYNGALTANSINTNAAYCFGSEEDWYAIRYAWIYIENVDRVSDMTEAEKTERKAEARMLIALSYAEMLRYIGGFPYIDHAVETTDDMSFPRLTFAESVEKIVALIDEALPGLEWEHSDSDNGRMTRAGALGLKLRVQLFAASPMFNSDTKWHDEADEYTCYGNYDVTRWEDALATAEQLLEELETNGVYELEVPASTSTDDMRAAFRKAYYNRASSEVLISTRRGSSVSIHDDMITNSDYWGPTLNYVNMFPWSDGTDFSDDFDWEDPETQPFFDADGEPTRDIRLYETVAVPGDIYRDGSLAPVYSNATSGFMESGTGFRMMKFILQQSSDRTSLLPHWPYLRLPEVYLSYAEILNHLNGGPGRASNGDRPEDYLNMVRTRLGQLPEIDTSNMDEDEFLEAVLRERALEFGYEEVHWFDLIRYGRSEDFTKTLYGLVSVGDNARTPTSYTFSTKTLTGTHARTWQTNFNAKWYLAPIPQTEINKQYGMTQNPGW